MYFLLHKNDLSTRVWLYTIWCIKLLYKYMQHVHPPLQVPYHYFLPPYMKNNIHLQLEWNINIGCKMEGCRAFTVTTISIMPSSNVLCCLFCVLLLFTYKSCIYIPRWFFFFNSKHTTCGMHITHNNESISLTSKKLQCAYSSHNVLQKLLKFQVFSPYLVMF